jgi:hypothetical protein
LGGKDDGDEDISLAPEFLALVFIQDGQNALGSTACGFRRFIGLASTQKTGAGTTIFMIRQKTKMA